MDKTIIIADDHPFTVHGMQTAIASVSGLTVVGTAKNGIDAIALIKRVQPDLALLDLSMPGANGLEVFLEAKRWSPNTRFAIITGRSATALFKQLYDKGIDGLFVKNSDPVELSNGISRMAAGERVISDDAMAAIEKSQNIEKLSSREFGVLQALANGKSNKQIADSFGLSPKTIDTHRTNLLRKMKVNSTAALLVKSIRLGIIIVDPNA